MDNLQPNRDYSYYNRYLKEYYPMLMMKCKCMGYENYEFKYISNYMITRFAADYNNIFDSPKYHGNMSQIKRNNLVEKITYYIENNEHLHNLWLL